MGTESILLENAKEYLTNATTAKNKNQFNTAVTLFFKTIAALCDLFIYKQEGRIPTSHTERFRILENSYRVIYSILDRDFSFYQDSYTKKLTKESADLLEKDVRKISELIGIKL